MNRHQADAGILLTSTRAGLVPRVHAQQCVERAVGEKRRYNQGEADRCCGDFRRSERGTPYGKCQQGQADDNSNVSVDTSNIVDHGKVPPILGSI
ncbi:hypothetical protein [Bradyrhizobium jicamae]|uniref:hypothetical protein n=1 Tax=Bradyrhizobium jicamae TaxID=280332 RepID=UPI003D9AF1EA